MNKDFFSELAGRLARELPENARIIREDVAANFEAQLQSAFARLDLVTREEFDVQQRVLAATRARLEALEATLARLEAGQQQEPGSPG